MLKLSNYSIDIVRCARVHSAPFLLRVRLRRELVHRIVRRLGQALHVLVVAIPHLMRLHVDEDLLDRLFVDG